MLTKAEAKDPGLAMEGGSALDANGTWGWASALCCRLEAGRGGQTGCWRRGSGLGGALLYLLGQVNWTAANTMGTPWLSLGLALGQKSRKHMYKDVFYMNKTEFLVSEHGCKKGRVDKARCILDSPSALSQWGQRAFWPFAGVLASIFPSNICFCLAHIREEEEAFQ